jgi:alkylated DNA repair dioxygenase AlkB
MRLVEDAITGDEEQALIALVEGAGLANHPQDQGNPRSFCYFGYRIDFEDGTMLRCPPMPEALHAMRVRAAALADIAPEAMVECVFNRYEPGAQIQQHIDKPVWGDVVGVSLGARALLTMRGPGPEDPDGYDIWLEPRSMYLFAGDARHLYAHGVPPVEHLRYSITFRSLSAEGRRLSEGLVELT